MNSIQFKLGIENRRYRYGHYKCDSLMAEFVKTKPLGYGFLVKRIKELNLRNFKSEAEFDKIISDIPSSVKLTFRKNYPVIAKYFGDYVCCQRKFIIEIDGGYHKAQDQIDYDKKRDGYLNSIGWKVIRISYPNWTGIEYLKQFVADKSRVFSLEEPHGQGVLQSKRRVSKKSFKKRKQLMHTDVKNKPMFISPNLLKKTIEQSKANDLHDAMKNKGLFIF